MHGQIDTNTQMYIVKDIKTESLEDLESGDEPTTIKITTTKKTKRTLCLNKASAFIVADRSRNVDHTVPQSSGAGLSTYGNIVHTHPQIGTWNCNPPREFYAMMVHEMDGNSPAHKPKWVNSPWTNAFPETPKTLHLPLCDGQDGQDPNVWPFEAERDNQGGWEYNCGVIGYEGGNALPVIMSYNVMEVSDYEKTWEPAQLCKKPKFGVALGVAMAYSAYIEMFFTAIFVLSLYGCGMVVLKNKGEGLRLSSLVTEAGPSDYKVEMEMKAMSTKITQLEAEKEEQGNQLEAGKAELAKKNVNTVNQEF